MPALKNGPLTAHEKRDAPPTHWAYLPPLHASNFGSELESMEQIGSTAQGTSQTLALQKTVYAQRPSATGKMVQLKITLKRHAGAETPIKRKSALSS